MGNGCTFLIFCLAVDLPVSLLKDLLPHLNIYYLDRIEAAAATKGSEQQTLSFITWSNKVCRTNTRCSFQESAPLSSGQPYGEIWTRRGAGGWRSVLHMICCWVKPWWTCFEYLSRHYSLSLVHFHITIWYYWFDYLLIYGWGVFFVLFNCIIPSPYKCNIHGQ